MRTRPGEEKSFTKTDPYIIADREVIWGGRETSRFSGRRWGRRQKPSTARRLNFAEKTGRIFGAALGKTSLLPHSKEGMRQILSHPNTRLATVELVEGRFRFYASSLFSLPSDNPTDLEATP